MARPATRARPDESEAVRANDRPPESKYGVPRVRPGVAIGLVLAVVMLVLVVLTAPLWLCWLVLNWHKAKRDKHMKDARGYWSHPEAGR